jgi:hypothetical protein
MLFDDAQGFSKAIAGDAAANGIQFGYEPMHLLTDAIRVKRHLEISNVHNSKSG